MPRTVVTGGAGFLGSHLVDRLIQDSHEVICLDNLITADLDHIAHLFGHERFRYVKLDVTEYLYVDGPVDSVLHFASPASPADYLKYPIQTLKVGALGTHKALGLAKVKKARFLLASTSEVYGDPLVNPQPEAYWGNVNPIGPRGVYDEAKRFAEAMTMAYRLSHGLDTRIVRIFNTYGPRQRINDGRAVANFIVQALHNEPLTVYGDGSQTRSFCFVSDMIEGLTRLLDSNVHEPVNLGNPDEISIRELAHLVKELVGSQSPIEFQPLPQDDPRVRRPDITQANEKLGWKPKVDLRTGLKETIAHFRHRLQGSL
ncbi:MAG: UDP-glucuronic acid decarboxylase family protein [Candidatus Methylomirabilales bacterium]